MTLLRPATTHRPANRQRDDARAARYNRPHGRQKGVLPLAEPRLRVDRVTERGREMVMQRMRLLLPLAIVRVNPFRTIRVLWQILTASKDSDFELKCTDVRFR